MTKPKADYKIQTVTNALRLLEAFRDDDELGVSELSRRLELHKNNVFRLLATLEQSGFVEQSPTNERYRLGVGCMELGQSYSRGHPLLRRARPVLEELSQSVRESAHLAILRGFDVVHLDGVQSPQMVLTALRIGQQLPAHCTALGKVLLACGPGELQERYDRDVVAGTELARRTQATIVDPHKFFEHLRSVAIQGFAVDLEECESGLHCAAAPVYDASGRLMAAISVSGPSFRLAHDALTHEVAQTVASAADKLSHQVGLVA